MKKLPFLFTLFLFTSITLIAQKPSWPDLDKSPMDAVTYPSNAAWRNYLTGDDRTKRPTLQVYYSRPQKKDRAIFGSLIPFGKEWRLGANQATELLVYSAVDIGGTTLSRGTYTMFATPGKDKWLISISSETNIWGSNNRDKSFDVISVEVPVEEVANVREALSMSFQKVDDNNVNLVIEWDQTRVKLPVNLNPIIFEDLDVSPMDEAIYPVSANGLNYIEKDKREANKALIRIRYSRPQKKDREIFGALLKYGEVWRVGANQSTLLRLYENANIGGVDVKAGQYNLYAVVNESTWDFILNTDMPAWGAANRDETKDVATFSVPVNQEDDSLEALSIKFKDQEDGSVHIMIGWDKHRANIPVVF